MKTLRMLPPVAIALNILVTGLVLTASTSQAAPLNLSDNPLFAAQSAPPLTLMTMGRDHKLYYEAYNDASDLNGDGVLDTNYKPDVIDYYGYFGSNICYVYDGGNNRFEPSSITTDKRCSGGSEWSGDFLNYLTTSRIDALRKVFYGGTRSVDTNSETVLERSYIPQDAHSWGKEYTDIATSGFDIREYSPLNLPVAGLRHLFANTTLVSENDAPLLRVLNDTDFRVWEWLSKERPVAGATCIDAGTTCNQGTSRIIDFVVRVRVCVTGLLEANCQAYPNGNNKPVGLLQNYGENDSMYFGLLTGSYERNTSGGVLRKNISSITDEINANDGTYTATIGIIGSMDRLRIANFRYGDNSYEPGSPGAWIVNRPMNEGEFTDWGNPIAEMMYEGMRYFAGKASPTSAFNIANFGNDDAALGLPLPNWIDPYDIGNGGFSSCSKPFQIVISDINPSYDSDQLPGSFFGSFTGDVSSLDVSVLADTISSNEPSVAGNHFIGQVGAIADGAPTSKMVTTLSNVRGLAPEEPTKQGSYYSASIGYFGTINDINPADGKQKIDTFSVALASPLPNIEIPVGNSTITLVPFAKSVAADCWVLPPISRVPGDFQLTNTIVDFYVESLTPTFGRFRINFEDVEQAADHDMDAIAVYEYTVNSNGTVTINMDIEYSSGCIVMHMGYVISGTTADGTYLEVRNTGGNQQVDYFLDTPNIAGVDLPTTATRIFTPQSSGASTTFLKDPLWYAAKWGGFQEDSATANNLPDLASEWDEDGDGNPDNYFLVTNALDLSNQLSSAFNEIIARSGVSASSAALTSGQINSDTALIRSTFNTGTWTGDLKSYAINNDPNAGTIGAIIPTPIWSAEAQLPPPGSRNFFTHDGGTSPGGGRDFAWDDLTSYQQNRLDENANGNYDGYGRSRAKFLRGVTGLPGFRNRVDEDGDTHILGDMVNSSPVYVGNPRARYPNNWGSGAPENTSPYSAFFNTFKITPRVPMVYVGGNDGMLHGFNAETSGSNMGKELLAYIPNEVFPRLSDLTSPSYSHKFYVDGSPSVADVFFGGSWKTVLVGGLNRGGQAIYALDITNPASMDKTKVLWEFSDKNDGVADDAGTEFALGYTYSKPAIVRLHNGEWAAIFGNGYNNTENDGARSTTGHAVLYIVDIADGSVIRKINTKAGGLSDPNGLATVTPVDIDGDFIVDYVYAGDLLGNMWKFDLKDSSASNWKVAYGTTATPLPLFVARDSTSSNKPQPITAKANVGFSANGVDLMIYFGTGKYLEAADNTTTGSQDQAFYGIIDNGNPVTGLPADVLLEQEVEPFVSTSCTNFDGTAGSCDIRVTSDEALGSEKGWYMKLPDPGERVIYRPILLAGTVLFVTLIPSGDECNPDGSGWFMQVDAYDGSRLDNSPFDLNGDGIFDDADQVSYDDGGTTVDASGSGRRIEGGAPTGAPAILNDSTRRTNINYTDTTNDTDIALGNDQGLSADRQSWRQIK
ncbi:MAG: fimbrial assembly protein [Gammaproteobacteria bacterium]|nr:fimbrial assembly protein [Gammaproteobacteria bacterium]